MIRRRNSSIEKAEMFIGNPTLRIGVKKEDLVLSEPRVKELTTDKLWKTSKWRNLFTDKAA